MGSFFALWHIEDITYFRRITWSRNRRRDKHLNRWESGIIAPLNNLLFESSGLLDSWQTCEYTVSAIGLCSDDKISTESIRKGTQLLEGFVLVRPFKFEFKAYVLYGLLIEKFFEVF